MKRRPKACKREGDSTCSFCCCGLHKYRYQYRPYPMNLHNGHRRSIHLNHSFNRNTNHYCEIFRRNRGLQITKGDSLTLYVLKLSDSTSIVFFPFVFSRKEHGNTSASNFRHIRFDVSCVVSLVVPAGTVVRFLHCKGSSSSAYVPT